MINSPIIQNNTDTVSAIAGKLSRYKRHVQWSVWRPHASGQRIQRIGRISSGRTQGRDTAGAEPRRVGCGREEGYSPPKWERGLGRGLFQKFFW